MPLRSKPSAGLVSKRLEGQMTRYGSKEWTPADDDLLRKLALENYAPVEVATELKRSLSAVNSRAHRLGISLGYYSAK